MSLMHRKLLLLTLSLACISEYAVAEQQDLTLVVNSTSPSVPFIHFWQSTGFWFVTVLMLILLTTLPFDPFAHIVLVEHNLWFVKFIPLPVFSLYFYVPLISFA